MGVDLADGPGRVADALGYRRRDGAEVANAGSISLQDECERISQYPALAGYDRLRVYFYDASPGQGVIVNPLNRAKIDLSTTQRSKEATSLLQTLELCPDFALRMGETVIHRWQLGHLALEAMTDNPRIPTAQDFVPNIEQKGVDLRIDLDIARLALRQLVPVIVVVTGDSDLVPSFNPYYLAGVYTGEEIKEEMTGQGGVRSLYKGRASSRGPVQWAPGRTAPGRAT